ncbi:MAG: ATP-binding cassette domain-containing protein, partial [Actinomycetota bacterium]
MDGGSAIVAQGVVRSFGRLRALDGLDLEVRSGEMLGLVGPNGAGKTTFIRVVAGLLSPSAGRVRVLGARPGRSVASLLGYMTQSPALYEDLTIVENLDFFGRVYGLSRHRARLRGRELLELLRLNDKAETPVRALSGGQR